MEILDQDTRRVLQVVDYAERTGEPLSVAEFEGLAENPRRRVHPAIAIGVLTPTTESVLSFVTRTKSVDKAGDKVRLTRLGTILLREAREIDELKAQPQDIVLAAGDDWASGDLFRAVRKAGLCMVIDPFCREAELNDLVRYTETTRVLVGPRVAGESFDLTLNVVRAPRKIEVRVSSEFHDRVVIPDSGAVLAIGASLNGIGRDKPTFLVSLNPELSASVRKTYEDLWDAATPWAPLSDNAGPVDH